MQNALKVFLPGIKDSQLLNEQQWLTLVKTELSVAITKARSTQLFRQVDGNIDGTWWNSTLEKEEMDEFLFCGPVM